MELLKIIGDGMDDDFSLNFGKHQVVHNYWINLPQI